MMENLRLHSPITFLTTRIATADIPYGDQVIPKGAFVGVDIANIQKHPDFWENPENLILIDLVKREEKEDINLRICRFRWEVGNVLEMNFQKLNKN